MKKAIFVIILALMVKSVILGKAFLIGTTTDIDPEMAGEIYEVASKIYKNAEEGSSIKLMSATSFPSLKIDVVKEDYPNEMLAGNARKAFENSLVEMLGLSLRANRGRKAFGFIDTPRLVRELRNHVGETDTVVVLIGSRLWTRDPEFSFVDEGQSEADLRLRRPSYGSVSADKFLSPFSMDGVPDMPRCRVVWFDPTGDMLTGDDAFKSEVANFWNCMFREVSIPMAPIQSNASTTVSMALSEGPKALEFIPGTPEEGARMLTMKEMRPKQIFIVDAVPFDFVWVGDLSPSQSNVREAMARRLTDSRGKSEGHHGLFVFETGGGILYSESSDVLEIAAAFRQVKPSGGADSIGSFSATLKEVRDKLRSRNARNSSINILSDVAPAVDESTPKSERYPAILRDIVSDGHKVTFVRTNRKLDVRKFLPKDVKIKVTDL